MQLSEVVPWGRSYDEYVAMFQLSPGDLQKKILGCGDGPACFNAELTARGGQIISADPLYRFDADQIRTRIEAVYPQIVEQVAQSPEKFIWTTIPDVASLGRVRMAAMDRFLEDYEQSIPTKRYVNAALPQLPFETDEFDLALCSHYLFLYSDHVSQKEHIASMQELCRVAKEVRVYPLVTLGSDRVSAHLGPVMKALEHDGITVSFTPVTYRFQVGATEMLVAKSD